MPAGDKLYPAFANFSGEETAVYHLGNVNVSQTESNNGKVYRKNQADAPRREGERGRGGEKRLLPLNSVQKSPVDHKFNSSRYCTNCGTVHILNASLGCPCWRGSAFFFGTKS